MDELNILFRALINLTNLTEKSSVLLNEKQHILDATSNENSLTTKRTVISVNSDWIDAIEEGLVHIEKAINESRQFIRSLGEVVPIEKVKHVSKDSITHLAKHSDLITKKSQSGDFVPDKLYMVERLSDFTVYENKFLYMLLMYLKSFISYRYEKLQYLSTSYQIKLNIDKSIIQNNRKSLVTLSISDEQQNDPFLKKSNPIKETLEKIETLLKGVMHLLATDLMQEVAKVPMLKPPVVKTNVLKMNKNFKRVVTLYDYISSYDADGFTAKVQQDIQNPLSDDADVDFCEAIRHAMFIAYKHGLCISQHLKSEYESENERIKEEERQSLIFQIQKLRSQVTEKGIGIEEYLLLVEKYNKQLEEERDALLELKEHSKELERQTKAQNEKLSFFKDELSQREEKIKSLNQEHLEAVFRQKEESEKALKELELAHQNKLECIQKEHSDKICELNKEFESKICQMDETLNTLKAENKNDRAEFVQKIDLLKNEHTQAMSALRDEFSQKVTESEKLLSQSNVELDSAKKESLILNAKINAIKKQNNLLGKDESFTSMEEFKSLEQQYEAFTKLFKEEWKKTKKSIRKEILSNK